MKPLKIVAKKITFIAILLVWKTTAFAQQQLLDSLKNNFDEYRSSCLVEKVYLHTDRESYLTGESVWFKAYVTDGSFHKPVDISKVLYVELLNSSSLPVLQTKISLENGKGNGSVYLPATIQSGNYVLRAYTNWMKNFSGDYFFQKAIAVVNTFKRVEVENTVTTKKPDVQFFPEGGNLVDGISATVAFRVVSSSGVGLVFQGALLNQQNDTVVVFRPHKFGIGSFRFRPQADQQYTAVITDDLGNVTTHPFVSVLDNGYTLQMMDSADRASIHLSASGKDDVIFLFIHARNSIAFAQYQMLVNGKAEVVIPEEVWYDGVNHITVFNHELKPVCERLYFKMPKKTMQLKVATDNHQYVTRRRVKAEIVATATQSANVSVSVYRTDSLYDQKNHLLHYMWLSADLKGTIESPEYYFSNDPMAKKALDNLMLTHGWRRFKWDAVFNTQPPVRFLPEYRGHLVQGFVKTLDGQPAPGILTYLAAPGKAVRVYSSRSKEDGEVLFEMQNFKGTSEVVVQNNITTDSIYEISIANPFSKDPASLTSRPFLLQPSALNSLLERSVAMQAQDIFFDHRTAPLLSTDSSSFFGEADETYYLDDFTRFPVMEEVMREYVPGVWVRKRKDGFHFMVIDNVNRGVFNNTPLMLLDGVPFFDEDEIMNFNPLLIKKLEVVTKRYYLGPGSYPGIVSYRTYSHDLAGFELQPKALKLDYEGLQLQREFYQPVYDSPALRDSKMPDQRTLLYWNPDVNTSAAGIAGFEFYTSDVPGVYQVVVEGMTNQGYMGFGTTEFTVRPELH